MFIRNKTASFFEQTRLRLHEAFPYIFPMTLMIVLGAVALLMIIAIWTAVLDASSAALNGAAH